MREKGKNNKENESEIDRATCREKFIENKKTRRSVGNLENFTKRN